MSALVSADEAAGLVTITFTLSAVSSLAVSVDFATADGCAVAPSDYISASGRLTFTAGITQTVRTFTIIDDGKTEADETFTVNLSNLANAQTRDGLRQVCLRTAQVVVSITNDDIAGVSAPSAGIVI